MKTLNGLLFTVVALSAVVTFGPGVVTFGTWSTKKTIKIIRSRLIFACM